MARKKLPAQWILKVYSTPEQGSSFNIYLPIIDTSKNITSIQPDDNDGERICKNILIDDEEIVKYHL
jgi:hypothetical protein